MNARVLATLAVSAVAWQGVSAQVTSDRIRQAAQEPHNWLTYSGGYASHRYSLLNDVTPANVASLELKWVYQGQAIGAWQATPLVVDGVMYVTQRPNDVLALDAVTGRVFWIYRHTPSEQRVCCGANNRGLAILDHTLFLATLDARLIAIDARSGRPLWNVAVGDPKLAYSMTLAPLVIKDKVVVGTGGGDYGVRGFIAAYDAATGKEAWRFWTIPGPGEPGHETWQPCPAQPSQFCDPEAWKHGGGSVWVTGAYDPELNLTYWGTGNPGPDWNPDQRPGDNLYTDSVVALDADTGALKWYFQFTPNDPYDYDAAQVPVLADMDWNGRPAKLMLWANRNGFYYVLDRATGRFLLGRPFVKVNWASGLDAAGRPIPTPQPAGAPTWPGVMGGTNWFSPSYSPRTGWFYLTTWEDNGSIVRKEPARYQEGRAFGGGGHTTFVPTDGAPNLQFPARGAINTWTDEVGHSAVVALDPRTGEPAWKFPMYDVSYGGILTTASDLLFTGNREGYFYALDARSGAVKWRTIVGGQVASGPTTYKANNRQFIAVVAGHSLFAFGLRD
jgi:alcohol dehydrogenase (cytochrome c)